MLPVLLLCIGDSIREGWAEYIPCVQPHCNCQSTRFGIEHIKGLTKRKHWSAIVFNFGLWDAGDGVGIAEYKSNLERLVTQMDADRIYFCTTTPGRPRADAKWHDEAIGRYNDAALDVMKRHNVKVIDLHALCMRHREWWKSDADVHYTDDGYKGMAEYIKHEIVLPR
jgi:hypothetical protein